MKPPSRLLPFVVLLAVVAWLFPTMKKDAAEQLRAAIAASLATPDGTATLSIEEQATAAATHTLGGNANGWRNPYPASHPFSLLLEYQLRYVLDDSRFKLALQSRQTGKDFASQGEAVMSCLTSPGTEWLVAAPSERQSLDSLDKAKVWAQAFDLVVASEEMTREGGGRETLLASAAITFANGSKITAVPGKPSTVRGKSANVLLTEFDFFETPEETWKAILPSITNPLRGGAKKARLISTPNGLGSAMHKLWTKEDGKAMSWAKHLVTIYQAVLMGLPVDVAELREAMDSEDGFAQEYLCQWLEQSLVLLEYALLSQSESYLATASWSLEEATLTKERKVAGIDFGRSIDPSVLSMGTVAAGRSITRHVEWLSPMSTPEQVRHWLPMLRLCDRVAVDYTGPGIGFGDLLVEALGLYDPEQHAFGKVELVTFTAQSKRAMYPALRLAMERGNHLIPQLARLREDLHAVRQVIYNGAYSYEAPRTKDGHSDACASQALMVRAASGPVGDGSVSLLERPRVMRGDGLFAGLLSRSRRALGI